MDRSELPNSGDERAQLTALLDLLRSTILGKVEGVTSAQMATTHPPSSLTLAGLLKHLAMVEEYWFRVVLLGEEHQELWQDIDWDDDPDWEFRSALEDDPAELVSLYRSACASSRDAAATLSMDQLSVGESSGRHIDLRWTMLHMIEETARHAGHADLIRESLDGATGY